MSLSLPLGGLRLEICCSRKPELGGKCIDALGRFALSLIISSARQLPRSPVLFSAIFIIQDIHFAASGGYDGLHSPLVRAASETL